MEQWHKSEIVYDGKVVRLRVGDARLDDDSLAIREVVEHSGGVAMVPYIDGEVILVKQWRIAVQDHVVELPAGRLEPNETPEERALIELEEEIGYKAGRLEKVAACYCSPGFTDELDHIYLAFDLEETVARPEPDERIEIVRMSIDEVRAALANQTFNDAKTIIGLDALCSYLDRA